MDGMSIGLPALRRSHRAGINLSALGADAEISHNTARAWLSILEACYIIHRVPASHAISANRWSKPGACIFLTAGWPLLCLRIRDLQEQSRLAPLRGRALFEKLGRSRDCCRNARPSWGAAASAPLSGKPWPGGGYPGAARRYAACGRGTEYPESGCVRWFRVLVAPFQRAGYVRGAGFAGEIVNEVVVWRRFVATAKCGKACWLAGMAAVLGPVRVGGGIDLAPSLGKQAFARGSCCCVCNFLQSPSNFATYVERTNSK